MLFFYRSILIQTFLNAYIIYRIGKSKDIAKVWKRTFIIIYMVEVLAYFTGLLFTPHLPVETVGIIHRICGIWSILQIYLLGLIWLFDLLFFVIKRYLNQFYKLNRQLIRRIKVISFTGICILIGIGLAFGYHNFTHPVVKNQSFDFTSHSSPVARHSYKMLVASDFHLGYIVDVQMLRKYVGLINEQHPDMVVIDGDLMDWDLRPFTESNMQEELNKIKAPEGVYFVPGNHEYRIDSEAALDWITRSGMTILKDSIVSIDDNLWLIGRDDEKNDNRKSMEDLMKNFDTSKPCIMLAHRPSNIKDACAYNIPLTICGHTHSGQIFPANLISGFLYTNPYGWKEINGCCSFTTSGLGLSGFPLRLGSRCEIVVFDIRIY